MVKPLYDIVQKDKLPILLRQVNYRAPNGCWEWQGWRTPEGYGMFRTHTGGKARGAHRLFFEIRNDAIPKGLVLDHLCRNPPCVNPSHLEAVSPRENVVVRGVNTTSGNNAKKTHCNNGHEFDYFYKTAWGIGRGCKRCRTENYRRWAAKKRKNEDS